MRAKSSDPNAASPSRSLNTLMLSAALLALARSDLVSRRCSAACSILFVMMPTNRLIMICPTTRISVEKYAHAATPRCASGARTAGRRRRPPAALGSSRRNTR